DREGHRFSGYLVLDPGVIPAAEVQLRHVGGRARGPQVVEVRVARVLERVPHLDRAERVDVQVARAAPEERRAQGAVGRLDEVLPLEEREDVLDLPPELVDRALVREEGAAEELEQLRLRRHVPRRDRREGVDPQGRLRAELRFDGLGWALEVFVDELVDVVLVLRDEDRLADRVVLRAACPPAHLLDLKDWDWRETEVHVVPVQVADDDPPRGEVHARGDRTRRNDALHAPSFELRYNQTSMIARVMR